MKKYCLADVELLSKAVLKYRYMFKHELNLDVDPFRYITIASLVMSMYLNQCMPPDTIVGNSKEKNVSLVSREWITYLDDPNLIPEVPIKIYNRNKNEKSKYKNPSHTFTVDALDKKNKIVKEFYGCYWHGCKKCFPESNELCDKTMERTQLLENAGYNVDAIWECEWNNIKNNMDIINKN